VKVSVVSVGPVKHPLRTVVAEYEGRAARYWKLDVVEVEAGARGARGDAERVKASEAERILARLPGGVEVVALTRAGDRVDSAAFAAYLERLALHGAAGAAFVIGGAFGLGDGVLRAARRTLSLSPLTLPHELARLVLAEQLYRAGTILRGEPYHKGARSPPGAPTL
jgi:23S rRNA (pseudouridine1915-N3)-methyltransferase